MCRNHREDKFLRATKNRHYSNESKKNTAKADNSSTKLSKGLKKFSFILAASVAAVLLIVPTTTTIAPNVDAFDISRAAINSFENSDDVQLILAKDTEPVTIATEATEVETTVEPTTQAPTEEETTEAVTEAEEVVEEVKETEPMTEAVIETVTEPQEDEVVEEVEDTFDQTQAGYLLSIKNPDKNYKPKKLTLSKYDREKLECLVMGEAGSMGYTGCALVAQTIRDSMIRSNTTSIDKIISDYKYYAPTNKKPNKNVKDAVSFIFDDNGSAVQHRILCFYIGKSEWHETQEFVVSCGNVRFFDLKVK